MDAREAILDAVRRAKVPAASLPDLDGLGAMVTDPGQRFAEAVEGAGGSCVRVADRAAAERALAELSVVRAAGKIASVADVGQGNVDLASIADPHELDGLDVAVLPGEVAVAENGAVWVDGAALPHRALFVVCEHLVLVVPAAGVVADMHAAYARLGARAAGYATFIAGPSKTADIEQALVVGAHGARSLTVIVVG